MKVLNILISAFRALQRNKMRSFLTMLGIIIGVAAVIAMLAIGQGAQYSVGRLHRDSEGMSCCGAPFAGHSGRGSDYRRKHELGDGDTGDRLGLS